MNKELGALVVKIPDHKNGSISTIDRLVEVAVAAIQTHDDDSSLYWEDE